MMRIFSIGVSLLSLQICGCSSDALTAGAGGSAGVNSAAGGSGTAAPGGMLERAAYPEGPYGRGVGATIANLRFLGWRDPVASEHDPMQLEQVSLSDFYNPGGTASDVRIILLNSSAVWCAVCKAEYKHLRDSAVYAAYRPKGVEILGVLFEDSQYNPAKPSDLVVWGGSDGFDVTFPLVVDPGFKTGVYFESDATPMNMLIDATTMRIVDLTMGYDTASPKKYWQFIDSLLPSP
ncbi:MAG TPA: TlpA disulfide reductase family protein [Polyangiaceae bacterium]|nr:TlpA disulfide reductase family protein [Polyangiaceae bacterium]